MNRLAAMEAFVRVIDTGSFSSAARQLRVGQPAISKAIAQLENRLGVRLLLRSTHGLTSTEAGQNFYEHARRSIEEADEADLAARGAGATLSGRLRICAAVTFARLHVVPHLARFLAENPALDVEVVLDDRNVDLIEAGIDVAIRMSELSEFGADSPQDRRGPACRGGHALLFREGRGTDDADGTECASSGHLRPAGRWNGLDLPAGEGRDVRDG